MRAVYMPVPPSFAVLEESVIMGVPG
jgi:hypothetical protein